MSNQEQDRVLAFDTLFTTNQIQKLKVLLSYLPPGSQKQIAIYIKYMELQYTISFFEKNPCAPFPARDPTPQMISDLIPYCSPAEKKQMEQMQSMFSMMQNYQEMMEMLSTMKELFPDMEQNLSPEAMSGFFSQGDLFSKGDFSNLFDLFAASQTP